VTTTSSTDTVQHLTNRIFRYAELFDTGRFDEFAAQFEHGVWHKADPGADGVREYVEEHVLTYDGSPRTKHVTTNLVLDVDEEAGTATAGAYVTVFQALPDFPLQPIFSGRYRDRFERVDGDWRWVERRVLGDLYGDTSRHVRRTNPSPSDAVDDGAD
jgi:3-phenylpropionate/cinnamic acid dioxygenase small subunit